MAKLLNNVVELFCIAKCHAHCSMSAEVKILKFFLVCPGLAKENGSPEAPITKYIKV